MMRLAKPDVPLEVPAEPLETALHLVRVLAQKAYRRCNRMVPLEELVGEAALALSDARRRFDEHKQVPFGAYVTMVIRHHLMQVVAAYHRGKPHRFISFADLSVCHKDGSLLPYDVPCFRTRRPDEEAIRRELLERVQQVLPPRWFKLLEQYYIENRTLEEIGISLGVSKQRVGQMIAQACDRAKRCLSTEEAA